MSQLRSSLLGLAGLLAYCGDAPAEIVTFNLNPAQSTITISGSTSGAAFQEQGPGSMTTGFSGSLQAEVTSTTIQFLAGSLIDARTNGVWAPLPDGSSGTAAADFGAHAANGLADASAALRNFILTPTSPVIPLAAGSFNSGSLAFEFPAAGTASLDYRVTGLVAAHGSEPLQTRATNNVTTAATLVDQGGTQTLTLPVKATFLFDLLSAGDTPVTITGSLVGVRAASPVVVFNAGSITVNGSALSLQWQAAAGQTFRVESSTNLVNWTNRATNITSGSTSYSWSGTASGPKEYFRLGQ